MSFCFILHFKYSGILKPVMDSIDAVSEKCQEIYKAMITDSTEETFHFAALEVGLLLSVVCPV